MTDLNAKTSGEIFRKNNPMILAMNRHQASIIGAMVAYSASGYKAGTVMARNNVSGLYQAYNDAGSSGINTATGILFNDIDVTDFADASSSVLQNVIIAGQVYYTKLTGIDANGLVDLGARVVVDAVQDQIMIF